MTIFRLIVIFLFIFPSFAVAAECPTELKPSDGYKELSATLKCLSNRITALEKSTAPTGTSTPPRAPSGNRLVRLDDGCFVIPTELTKVVDRIKPGDKFCSIDGRVMSRIEGITDDKVAIVNSNGNYNWSCRMNSWCEFNWNSRVQFNVTKITFAAPGQLYADLELKPK